MYAVRILRVAGSIGMLRAGELKLLLERIESILQLMYTSLINFSGGCRSLKIVTFFRLLELNIHRCSNLVIMLGCYAPISDTRALSLGSCGYKNISDSCL